MRIRKKGEKSQEPHKSEVKTFLEGYKAWIENFNLYVDISFSSTFAKNNVFFIN